MPSGIKRSEQEFLSDMQRLHPTFRILSHYIGSHTPIKCQCNKCGHIWETEPSALYRNGKCPRCEASNKVLSQSEFVAKISQINPNIKILGKYVNNKTSIKCLCKVCKHTWMVKPYNLSQGKQCPICSNLKLSKINSSTQEYFEDKLKAVNPKIKILGKYKNAKTKIECECLICEHRWLAQPSNLLYGYGCPQCWDNVRGLKHRKSNEIFLKELQDVQPTIVAVEEYITATTPITFQCTICGHNWKAIPDNIIHQLTGCPKCVASNGEQKIMRFLEKNHIEYQPQKRFKDLIGTGGGYLSYDFYIPQNNLLIEYQGQFHDGTVSFQTEEAFEKQQTHDNLKREYAEKNNIKLLEIWYYEAKEIDKILTDNLVA